MWSGGFHGDAHRYVSGRVRCIHLETSTNGTLAAYVHYPTISTNMLARVKARTSQYNNASGVAQSSLRTYAKLMCVTLNYCTRTALTLHYSYYNLFAAVYSISLREAQTLMVNSSWTKKHIDYLISKSPLQTLQQSARFGSSALHHTNLCFSRRP